MRQPASGKYSHWQQYKTDHAETKIALCDHVSDAGFCQDHSQKQHDQRCRAPAQTCQYGIHSHGYRDPEYHSQETKLHGNNAWVLQNAQDHVFSACAFRKIRDAGRPHDDALRDQIDLPQYQSHRTVYTFGYCIAKEAGVGTDCRVLQYFFDSRLFMVVCMSRNDRTEDLDQNGNDQYRHKLFDQVSAHFHIKRCNDIAWQHQIYNECRQYFSVLRLQNTCSAKSPACGHLCKHQELKPE